MIFWTQSQFSFTSNISPGPAINENNLVFTLNNSNAPAVDFDQYCIYEVAVTVSAIYTASSAANFSGDLLTAIDYDSDTALGSANTLRSYSTIASHQIGNDKCMTRLIKPKVAASVYQSVAVNGYAPVRIWVDRNNNSVPHYGLRTMVINSQVPGYQLEFTISFLLGFRNTV